MLHTKAALKAGTATVLLVASLAIAVPQAQNRAATPPKVTPPKDQFGFAVGDDYRLVNYTQFEEYLKKLDVQSERMIVTDIGMPDEDGFGLLKRVRADEALAPIPLIALTGFASPSNRDEALRAGFKAGCNVTIEQSVICFSQLCHALATLIAD